MLSAIICGTLGLVSTLWIGTFQLGMSLGDALAAAGVSMVSGMTALLIILKGEATPWARKIFFGKSRKTWPIFVFLYFAPIVALVPPARELAGFLWLAMPLIFCTGFTIIAFGPIQDRLVANRQRRALDRRAS